MEVSIPAGADLRHRLGHPKESLMHLILAGANSSLGRSPPPPKWSHSHTSDSYWGTAERLAEETRTLLCY